MDGCVINLFSELAENDFGFFQRVSTVAKIMTADVRSVTLDHTFEHTEELFRRHRIHHAPVLDDDGSVVGVVSDRDLLRHRPRLLGKAAEGDDDHLALKSKVSSFMTRGAILVPSNGSLVNAISLMLDHHVDCVLVHDEEHQLEGILTPRDIMNLVLLFHRVCTYGDDLQRFRLVELDLTRGLPLDMIFSRATRSVRDVMTKDVRCLSTSDSIADAIDLMKSLHVRHLPVVDENQQLLGMVSDREVLHYLPLPVPRPNPRATPEFRDTLFAVADKRSLRESVVTIMEKNPLTVKQNDLFTSAINVFLSNTVSGLAVVGADNRLCGIVTASEVLRVVRITLQFASLLKPPVISSSEWEKALS